MFCSEAAVNTGEPPTDSPDPWSSREGVSYEDLEAGSVQETGDREVTHEADSGYENSPCSIAGNNAFSFDQEYNADTSFDSSEQTSRLPEDEMFPRDIVSHTRSITTNIQMGSSSLPSSDSVLNPPDLAGSCEEGLLPPGVHVARSSSSPISIPLRSDAVLNRSLPNYDQQSHSNPLHVLREPSSFQMMVSPSVFSLPLSWPTMTLLGLNRGRWQQRSARPETGESRMRRGISANRRRLIDSDASSVSSSESDGPEDVFDAAEVDFLSCLPDLPSAPSQVPLSPTLLQPRAVRRSRSVSVNLPVDRPLAETISDVGRSLRRLSDEFSRQRQVSGGRGVITRRCTIADFDCSTLRSFECGDDSEDCFLAVVSEQQSSSTTRR